MKKFFVMAVAAILAAVSTQAQTKRSDDFRARYELKEVVVMSRHNIRSPLASGADYQRVTPHEWFQWSSPGSQLSLRGGVLETEMGQFFRKWVVDAGLLPDNYRPEGDEVLFYANSRQRTFATAKYFSAGFLPFANVEITHKFEEDKMDPVFTPQFTKMNDACRQQVLDEIQEKNGGPQAWMTSVQPTLTLMEQVLDMAQSPAAKNDTSHFSHCISLTGIDFPESMKHIDGDTFYGCDNLKSLYIRCPYSSIGSSFSCGSSLKEVFVQYDYEKLRIF